MSPARWSRFAISVTPRPVPRLRRSNEVVERDPQAAPGLPELLLHLIAIDNQIQAGLGGLLEHVLGVFVVAHHEARVEAGQPLVAGDDVSGDPSGTPLRCGPL